MVWLPWPGWRAQSVLTLLGRRQARDGGSTAQLSRSLAQNDTVNQLCGLVGSRGAHSKDIPQPHTLQAAIPRSP